MNKYEKIIRSFKLKNTLNPKVWTDPKNPEKSKMIDEVRKGLMDISEEFVEYLGDNIFVDDVVLTGSLANFNWSSYSDFDLHVIIDYTQFSDDIEVYKELFNSKKQVFNEKHNIKIFKYDVELYAQDVEESHFSSGTYSIMNNEWIKVPKKEDHDIEKSIIINKSKHWMDKIDSAVERSKKDGEEYLNTLKDKLKDYRQSGLEGDGELSYENLVFKFLRRSGHIEKLFDALNKTIDKKLSIESDKSNINEGYEEVINKSNSLMKLKDLVFKNAKYEYTPGMKFTYDENVKLIQDALNNVDLSQTKLNVDGKFGPETEKSVKEFQDKVKLPVTGLVDPITLMYLVAKMVVYFMGKDETKPTQKPQSSENFTNLDLNTVDGFRKYERICQSFINDRNPSAGITGRMMAECAKQNLSNGYVPPELALAQLSLEGGLSKDPKARPIRTNNPFNVGNVDSGKNKPFPSKKDGVCAYYNLMSTSYLVGGKNPEDLITNFVNTKGNRYASANEYEIKLKKIIDSIRKYTGI